VDGWDMLISIQTQLQEDSSSSIVPELGDGGSMAVDIQQPPYICEEHG